MALHSFQIQSSDHVISYVMIMPPFTKFDHLGTLSNAPSPTTQRRTAALIADPIDRVIISAFGGKQISLVFQTESSAPILDKLQICLVPDACIYSR